MYSAYDVHWIWQNNKIIISGSCNYEYKVQAVLFLRALYYNIQYSCMNQKAEKVVLKLQMLSFTDLSQVVSVCKPNLTLQYQIKKNSDMNHFCNSHMHFVKHWKAAGQRFRKCSYVHMFWKSCIFCHLEFGQLGGQERSQKAHHDASHQQRIFERKQIS